MMRLKSNETSSSQQREDSDGREALPKYKTTRPYKMLPPYRHERESQDVLKVRSPVLKVSSPRMITIFFAALSILVRCLMSLHFQSISVSVNRLILMRRLVD